MKPEDQHVYQVLKNSGAAPIRACGLGPNMSLAQWQNATGNATYTKPAHNTLSFYLTGGIGTRRVLSPHTTSDAGFPSAFCLLPEEVGSQWCFNRQFEFVHLYFDTSYLHKLYEESFDKDATFLELQDLTYQMDQKLNSLFRQFIITENWETSTDRLQVSQAANMALLHILKNYANKTVTTPNYQGELAPFQQKRIRDYIQQNLDKALLLQDLADICQLSVFHFAHAFKNSFGMAPHHFVIQQRLKMARSLLTNQKANLAEIALTCGFNSQSHFGARFKAETGLTPRQFQKLS